MNNIESSPHFDEEAFSQFFIPEEGSNNRPTPSSAHPLPTPATTLHSEQRPANLAKPVCFADTIGRTLNSVLERTRYAREHGGVLGIPSHLEQINKNFGGWQWGLHLFAGPAGVGKTAFLIQAAVHAAKLGYPVLINSFELSEEILSIQTLCLEAELVPSTYRNGQATDEEINRFIDSAQAQQEMAWTKNIFIIEADSRTTVDDLFFATKDLKEKYNGKPVLVMVDYLQRWARTQSFAQDMRLNVSMLSCFLREQIAKPLQCPVFTISNQNRSGGGKADMSSLKESGDLEYDSDTVIIVSNDSIPGQSRDPVNRSIQFNCLKNRFGSQFVMEINYQADTGRMSDADEDFKKKIPHAKRR